MSWFTIHPTEDEIKRQAAGEFLARLEMQLALSMVRFQASLDMGRMPTDVFNELGRDIKAYLDQYQDALEQLTRRLANAQTKLSETFAQVGPLREQLRKVQRDLDGQTTRSAKAEAELVTAWRALAVEQNARQKEVAELRAASASQNRIIARQQHKLNHLLGEPLDTDLSGD
jgi:chromosome segregation ATPase